mmetsp:Transcript_985/g.1565  ORF Transcript_985/g.1565 Transcript_985/m.1565 type:complete len:531 (+) Transcript_985:110-1702(+)
MTNIDTSVHYVEKAVMTMLTKIQQRLGVLEEKLEHLQLRTESIRAFAERRNNTNKDAGDAVDEAFETFAHTLAGVSIPCDTNKIIEAQIPRILVNVLNGSNSAIIGGCAITICKISLLHDDIRRDIVSVGGISACVHLIHPNQDPKIIYYIGRTLASLALLEEHKCSMSKMGALQALASHIQKTDDDKSVSSVLIALCHCVEKNDANKNTLIGLGITKSIECILRTTKCKKVISSAAKVITNLACYNAFAAQACLESKCVASLISTSRNIESLDTESCIAIMMACSNLSNTESNQILVGETGALQAILYYLENSDDSSVLKEASNACASVSYSASITRKRMGKLGAIEALVDIILYKGINDDINEAKSAVAASLALVTLIAEQTNRAFLEDSGELPSLVDLYEKTDSLDVLNAGAMFVCAMIPAPDKKAALLQEGRMSAIEKANGAQRILDRCSEMIYSRSHLPNWLIRGNASLRMAEDEACNLLEIPGRKNDVLANSLCKVGLSGFFSQLSLFREVQVWDQENFFGSID